ncbi:MAG: di-trans,poly-cis-decaprenylcistransferase [Candidatus Heimdallarchaeota archaeon]|nr:di-trans,poly-cis-decaprenylcistransferase [Candidatus Heimdallarchaeota archaeon]
MKIQSPIYRIYEKLLWRQIKQGPKPHHIGVILDGNRRYAKSKGLDVTKGHFFGADRVEELLHWCLKLQIKILTLYAFSTENFNRSTREVQTIMKLFSEKVEAFSKHPAIKKNKVKVKFIGQLDLLSEELNKKITKLENMTKDYDNFQINIAVGYGGRAEIVDAVKKIAKKINNDQLTIDDINEQIISKNLYTEGVPDPDLIIRTSGEERLSGFLLWQSAYSELYFTDVYWPAFRKIDFWRAIRTFQQRERRYGK